MVGASFGGIGFGFTDAPNGVDNCVGPGPFFGQKPFTFGVPQIVHVSFGGSASGGVFFSGDAFESFNGIRFYDAAGNLLQNVNFSLISVPEPSAASLLRVGGVFFMVVAMIGRSLAVVGFCKP